MSVLWPDLKTTSMIEIRHQFENEDWFVPDWKLRVLILGTFNPECGDPVAYFYGRKKNQLWHLVSYCRGIELHPNHGDDFLSALKEEGIACMDLIRSIRVSEERKGEICGKGYSDQMLFRGTNQRTYMTEEILEVIKKNPGLRVLPTWGKGSFRKKDELELARMPELPFLHSPSPASRVKLEEKRRQWYDVWHQGRRSVELTQSGF